MAQVWEFKLLHLERLLLRLLDECRDRRIRVMLIKGAAVTLSVYGGFGRRPMYDADLLVRPKDARAVWDLALELDWTWDRERFPLDSYADAHHLPPLFDAFGSGTALEIHSDLWLDDHPFAFEAEDMWREAGAIDVGKHRVTVPSLAHQLLHCSIHFAWSHRMITHAWRAFRDVAAFVDSGRVDWDAFVELARSSRGDTCAYWTLRLAKAVNQVAVPKSVLRRLRPRLPEFVLNRLERHFVLNLVSVGERRHCPSVSLERWMWMLGIRLGRPSAGILLPEAREKKDLGARVGDQVQRLRDWATYFSDVL